MSLGMNASRAQDGVVLNPEDEAAYRATVDQMRGLRGLLRPCADRGLGPLRPWRVER